jgi:shikimate kinase
MYRLKRTVALVGMMGAGKSSIGRRLAAKLGVPFRDADVEIEAAAGCSVSEIFERFGEAEFRKGERRVIGRLLGAESLVLATGGGAFINEETRAEIKAHGFSIWLKAPLELLVSRVRRRETRPLLKDGDPHEIMARLLAEREPIYAQADITLDSEEGPHAVVVDRLVAALEAHGLLETA